MCIRIHCMLLGCVNNYKVWCRFAIKPNNNNVKAGYSCIHENRIPDIDFEMSP